MDTRNAVTGAAVAVVAVSAILLGRWQLQRLAQRRARNAVFSESLAKPPLDLNRDWRPGEPIDSGRRIVAHGRFEPEGQIFLRGRAFEGAPGLHVVTPLRLDGTLGVIWVLRGFVRSPDAATPPSEVPAPDTGDVTVRGLAFDLPVARDSGQPLPREGTTTWKRMDRGVLTRARAGSLPSYLLLQGDASGPGRLAVVPAPPISNGPHLGYAIQWFGIALAAIAFGFIALWRGGRALTPPRAAP